MKSEGHNGLLKALLGGSLLALGAFGAALPALAQQAVVQPLPGPENQILNAALARLGKNPRDVTALVDAGNAALALGNVEAAVGFFARADQIQPNTPLVRAGLAGALVHSGNPYEAIPLFTEAEAAGVLDKHLNGERGLAYDLVGDNATAQKYYNEALVAAPSDEVMRRLALSQAIAGEKTAMETTLAPLLAKQDKAAWRIRAFSLAVLGRSDEAVTIAYQTMPQDLAAGMAPYLRYMPRLTKAQQAAAAMFGQFPRAAEIGRDDPRALKFAPPVRVASADTALVPKGEPLGSKRNKDKPKEPKPSETKLASAKTAPPVSPRVAPPELQPRRTETDVPAQIVVPKDTPPPPAARPAPPPVQVAVAKVVPPPAPVVAPVPVQPAPEVTAPAKPVQTALTSSTFDLGSVGKPAPAPAPLETKPAAPPPAKPAAPPPAPKAPSFAEAFGDLGAPTVKAVPTSGAVDIRKIAAARPKDAKPAHPSRIWIQVGTGRDKSSLAFTWKDVSRDAPELFKSKSPSITEWGRTNRLLSGPFETEAAANAFLGKLKREKIDAFLWTSPAGQVIDPLTAR